MRSPEQQHTPAGERVLVDRVAVPRSMRCQFPTRRSPRLSFVGVRVLGSGRHHGPPTQTNGPVVPEYRAGHLGLVCGQVGVSAKNSNNLSYKPPSPSTQEASMAFLSTSRNDLHGP